MVVMSDRTRQNYEITIKRIRDNVAPGSSGLSFLRETEKVVAWIEGQSWAVNTKKAAYIALKSVLRDMGDPDLREAEKTYETQMLRYRDEHEKVAQSQLMSEREKALYVPWGDILKAEQKLYESVATLMDYQDYVIYCLYTMVPPMRLDYSPMRVVNSLEEAKDVSGNCLVCGKHYKFLFREYKTAGKYGELELDIPRRLQRVLEGWLELNPSGWLLCDRRGRPLDEKSLGIYLSSVMKSAVGKPLGCSMLRHAYITYQRKGEKTLAQQKDMAKRMAHSINMSQLYRRID